MSQMVLYFLYRASVLSFYKDTVLALSIGADDVMNCHNESNKDSLI